MAAMSTGPASAGPDTPCRRCGEHPQARDSGWCCRWLRAEDRRRARIVGATSLDEYFEMTGPRASRFPIIEMHADSGFVPKLHSHVSRPETQNQPVSALYETNLTNHPRAYRAHGRDAFCGWCERPIRPFHAGRKVRADRQFCSAGCRKAAARRRARTAVAA